MSIIVCSKCCAYIDCDFDSERIMEIDGEYVCDNHDDFWQQVDNEERRRYEEEEKKDREAFEKMFNKERPWWYLIDQDENWIMRVTK